jgi:hypothetical protein
MKQNYFDFIICGAGASGLLLLKAIREDSFFNEKSILIIEKEIKNVNDLQMDHLTLYYQKNGVKPIFALKILIQILI